MGRTARPKRIDLTLCGPVPLCGPRIAIDGGAWAKVPSSAMGSRCISSDVSILVASVSIPALVNVGWNF